MSEKAGSRARSSRWISTISTIQYVGLYLTVMALPLFHTTVVNDVVLAKSGLALTTGGMMGVAWVLGTCFRGYLVLNSIPLYGAILLFVSASGVSLTLFAANQARGVEVLMLQLLGFLLFVTTLERIRSVDAALKLMRAVAWTSLVVAGIGLLEENGVFLLCTKNVRVMSPLSTIGNTNFVAHYLDLTIPVTASLLFVPGERSGWKGVLTVTALVITCWVMVLTQCRGGWVSVGLLALVFAAVKLRTMRWVRFVAILLLSAALISPMVEMLFNTVRSDDTRTLSGAVGDQIERTWERAVTTLDETDPSRSMRIILWKNTGRMIAAHPFGVGTGNYEFSLPAFRSMSQQREWKELTGNLVLGAYSAHNEYLEYLAETGIIGFLAIVAVFGAIFWQGWRYLVARREWTDRSVAAAGCLGAVGAALVHALFSFNLQDPVSGTLFWVLSGVLVSLIAAKDREATIPLNSASLRMVVAVVGVGVAVFSVSCGLRILIADGYYLKGMQRFNERKAVEAVEAMRQASEWREADFRHHHMLGVFTSSVGNAVGGDTEIGRRMYAEAEDALRRSIELHPHNAQALRLLGKTLLRMGSGVEAVPLLERAVELNPLEATNYSLLADAYRETGQHSRALQARKQALSFRPHDTDLMLHLATEYRLSGDFESSAGVLERAAKLKPNDGPISGNLGSVYLDLGELVESERALRVAIEADPQQAGWRYNLVRCLLRRQRMNRAREELVTALRLFPHDELLISLARNLSAVGDE